MADTYSDILWHYTKLDVLEKMLKPDGVNIRFKNIRKTNDKEETLILKEFLIKNKNTIIDKIGNAELKKIFINSTENDIDKYNELSEYIIYNHYIFCTTSERDSINFWNKEYAGTSGISIGFIANKLEIENIQKNNVFYENFMDIILNDMNDAYNDYNLKEIYYIKEYNFLRYFLDTNSFFLKHKKWKDEKEIRFLLTINNGYYKDFNKNEAKEIQNIIFDKNCISSIILGPKLQEHHREAVEKYLKDNGYDIDVELSHAYDFRNG
jgi:hypothetical protein